MSEQDITLCVVGNPNCGKTTLFNHLTGARQRVGNWPGVTVERKEGIYQDEGRTVRMVDIPGLYALGAAPDLDSLDERLAREFILSGEVDVIVNILDATNLERSLYLTVQLQELGQPMVVVLNMMDRVEQQELSLNAAQLEQRLGCPVVGITARTGEGLEDLRQAVRQLAKTKQANPLRIISYDPPLERAIDEVLTALEGGHADALPSRWLAMRLLEGDDLAHAIVSPTASEAARALATQVEAELGEEVDTLIADARFTFANQLAHRVLSRPGVMTRSKSDDVDRVVLNPWLGLPVFLSLMYLMFTLTINLGGAFVDFFDLAAQAIFVEGFNAVLSNLGTPDWLRVILADGVGGGVQVVATFVPIIGFLYLCLSVLEDSGYMARAAFLMDRYMRRIGLPGKSFVPLIVGFGCNIPAIMATRTLEDHRDRIMAVMMAPFMSCGARLAVYALFAAAFFPVGGQNIVFLLYIIGVLVAVLTGFALKHTVLRGEAVPFVMELPPYNIPSLRGVLVLTWLRLKSFLFGAGKVIVLVVTVLAFLNSWGTDGSFGNEDSDQSVISAVGRTIVPAFTPMGIEEDNWPATVGIFTGVFAKEVVVGTLDTLYARLGGENDGEGGGAFSLLDGLGEAVATIPQNLSGLGGLLVDPLDYGGATEEVEGVSSATFGSMAERFDGKIGAFSYMLFILLYLPCVAALGTIVREVGPRWGTFAALWTTGLAYGLAVASYQALTFTRHPGQSMMWITAIISAFILVFLVMRWLGQSMESVGPRVIRPLPPSSVTVGGKSCH